MKFHMKTIIQHSSNLEIATQIASLHDCNVKQYASHIRLYTNQKVDLDILRQDYQMDFNYLPDSFDFKQAALFVSDMDSTLINIECIDEIADFANLKPQVSEITERAMQGELDFDSSLAERVALLKGLNVAVLEKVYTQKLNVNPGGQELIHFFKNNKIKSAVVSGGFTYFTSRLATDIGLDYSRANTLAENDGYLTGTTQGPIVNARAKADFIHELCENLSLDAGQVIVAGDGANDLEMMKVAGLSVAYHAKRIVAEQANIVINTGGLDKIIDLFDE
jgi:phosphoserine phosphatase